MCTFLDGRFENSAFCVLAPNGQDWLTRAGRGPEMVLGREFRPRFGPNNFKDRPETQELNRIAKKYTPKAKASEALVPDFHSFRQALNVASADQRVLALVAGSKQETQELRESLKAVSNHAEIVGRFHFDFDTKSDWTKSISGEKSPTGIVLIRPGEFGMDGKVLEQLPLTTPNDKIVAAMIRANKTFAATTKKKNYNTHVAKGRELGIYFKGNVPYGEDRDGDGKI
ncbi:MAG: hypothetical protein CMJ78_26265, partial [Planctomycetaceae bacterium]|nr:hypothetical protein [Planctomycetaceae bacterium]